MRKVGKEARRGELVGTWNTKWDKWPVFIWGCLSSFTLKAVETDLEEKGASLEEEPNCHEFDPFCLLRLMSRYTMGTFVIFKLSPPLNDHLLLDNGNQSRLKMGGVHLALMKWMFSDAAWDTARNGPVLYFSKLPLSLCLIFCRIIGLLDSRSPFSDSPEINRSTQPSIHFPGVPPKVSELNRSSSGRIGQSRHLRLPSYRWWFKSYLWWVEPHTWRQLERAHYCHTIPTLLLVLPLLLPLLLLHYCHTTQYPYHPPKPIMVAICQGQQTNLRLQMIKFEVKVD